MADRYVTRAQPGGGQLETALLAAVPPAPDSRTQIRVRLPSNGVFYEGRQAAVTVCPFTVGQVRSVFAAVNAKSDWDRESTFAQAVQGSVTDFDVLRLTTDDYKYLLYWLRFNSYPTSPYVVTWRRPLPDGGEKEVRSVVTMTQLRIVECGHNKVALDKNMGYATVDDKLDMLKLDDESERYVAAYAQFLTGKDLAEKVRKLEGMPAETLNVLKAHMRAFAHGIVEEAAVTDPEEGPQPTTFSVRLTFELSDFFP